jgi:hypothetical protein
MRTGLAATLTGCGVLLTALVAAGCAGSTGPDSGSVPAPTSAPSSAASSAPSSGPTGPADRDRVRVVLDGRELVLTTYGSSTCPYRVRKVEPVDEHSVRITPLRYPPDRVCTMDYRPSTVRTPVPAGLSATEVREALVILESGRTVSVPVARG